MTKTLRRYHCRPLGRASTLTRGGPIGTAEVGGFELKHGLSQD